MSEWPKLSTLNLEELLKFVFQTLEKTSISLILMYKRGSVRLQSSEESFYMNNSIFSPPSCSADALWLVISRNKIMWCKNNSRIADQLVYFHKMSLAMILKRSKWTGGLIVIFLYFTQKVILTNWVSKGPPTKSLDL